MDAFLRSSRRFLTEHPLLAVWLIGLGLRLACAWFAVGFFARDDYFHVLDIALAWIDDPTFVWETSDKAGAGIRSHLLPRIVEGLLRLGSALGLETPTAKLRFIQATLGVYASLLVPATWMLTERTSERTQRIATALAAAHFVFPYVGTRLLIESAAIPPMVFGLAWIRRGQSRSTLWPFVVGGFLIGLACWLRYPIGVVGLSAAAVVAFSGYRAPHTSANAANRAVQVSAIAGGAAAAIVLQGLFDQLTVGEFLGPLRRNIEANLDPHERLTSSHPLSYLGLWVALTAPPLSVVVIPAMFKAGRREPITAIPWIAFVLFHSMIPHKEERFMIPALPLFTTMLAMVPDEIERSGGRFFAWAQRWRRPAWGFFAAIHAVALAIAVGAQSQANVRDAMTFLRDDGGANAVISLGPELQPFFLDRTDVPTARTSRPDLVWLGQVLAETQRQSDLIPNRFLCFESECGTLEVMLLALQLSCDPPTQFHGFWGDRLAFRLNPEHNRRRSTVNLYACRRPSLASATSHRVHRQVVTSDS
ncbi:MAG: hypothetical protein AAFP04_12725 [Myxococcota bacterium]